MIHRYPTQPPEQRARPGEPLRRIEVQILRRLAAGQYDGEIARALEISARTHRRYVTATMRKLGARTRAHAVAIAIRAGVINVTPGGDR